MLAEQRRRLIVEAVSERGSAAVTELARRLEVSGETIRRDIRLLDRRNRLARTHGGALALDRAEPAYEVRLGQNVEGKRAMARLAAALVPDGASVIVDFGTSAYAVADALGDHRRLNVYTPGLQAANRLAGRNGNQVHLLGGRLDGAEGATSGPDATAMLRHYAADFAFVGAGVVSRHPWLMDYSREAAELRSEMLLRGRTAVLLADHTKFGRMAPYAVANLSEVTHVITDREPDRQAAAILAAIGAETMVAGGAD
ncbi:MAG: DeoR/GlpR transcriptional regulator [Proteobacteria bacterium]|nr:DeoR/GlpR transcriptional regulator [Pseudomonadota bacterium]